MSEAARRVVDQKTKVTSRVGRYVGNQGQLALVDMGDQRVPVVFATPWVPEINEPVHVDTIDGVSRLIGPTAPKPGMGVVVTVDASGDYVDVITDFGTYRMPYAAADADTPPPGSGDSVGIDWSSGPKCYRLSTSPDPVPPPPDPGGGGATTHTSVFRAVDAGSIRKTGVNGWWNPRPWNSPSNFGAWFYGTQMADTIPDNAEFVGLEIYLTWAVRRWPNTLRWGTHTHARKDGLINVNGSDLWDPGSAAGWYTPPFAQPWFNTAKTGVLGVALNAQGSGQEEARSLAEDGQSGALRITWRA
ncbi:hypothetical protein [Microbacterium plantarum]|uniref:hypothetical protein n=1 Tax=Microbacterium plantarum TaxID=1816425 RepID=UPI002B4A23CB|nr:hypothetical protein [Microbacterium plantarum]WRK16493.1 hypothetical protein VC184_11300 [Microbacterium plantarum]